MIPFERVSRTIGERVLASGDYFDLLAGQPIMEAGPLAPGVVERALAPFVDLPPNIGRKRNFPVWASKVLHFARLDAFPVLDSAAVAALGLPASIGNADYARRYRPTFLAAIDDLRRLSDDDPTSPTLLRRLDKILYQVGLELKTRDGYR